MKKFNTHFKVVLIVGITTLLFIPKTFGAVGVTANPNSINYESVTINTTKKTDTHVQVSGLALLNAVSFNYSISGTNANQFSVPNQAGLAAYLGKTVAELLSELLTGGINIPVTYAPTSLGSHSATLNITVIGLIGSYPISVPLTGNSVPNYLQVVSMSPADGATNVLPATPIKIVYNRSITSIDVNGITLNGLNIPTSSVNISGSTLTITPSGFSDNSLITISVHKDVVKDPQGLGLQNDISLSFRTTPQLLFSEGEPISFIVSPNSYITESIPLTVDPILGNNFNIVGASAEITGTDASMFSVSPINQSSFINSLLSDKASVDVTYTSNTIATHSASLKVTLVTDNNIPITKVIALAGITSISTSVLNESASEKVVEKTTYYTLLGTKVDSPEITGLYIKEIRYTDGTRISQKVSIRK